MPNHQPDKGGFKGSAKATIALPFANPPAENTDTNTPTNTEESTPSKSSTQPDKGGPQGSAKANLSLPFANAPTNNAIGSNPSITQSTTDPYTAAREALDRDGYVVLSASLFPSFELETLRAAATRMTKAARAGKWPYIRTLPKQFPPWPQDPSQGIWGVQHLLHPQNPDHITFAKSYFDKELLRYVAALIQCDQDDLTMELYNMLVRPDHDFSLRWHRDDIPASASDEEELQRLNKPGYHAQWNLPLYDDTSLILIPGSHKRARTSEERNADPYAPHLPGQITVHLKAGEVAFYNNNILHRGVYSKDKERMTLHGSIGTKAAGQQRARNVLQHGVGDWAKEWDLKGAGDEEWVGVAEKMRERLVELGRESGDVGFYSKDE